MESASVASAASRWPRDGLVGREGLVGLGMVARAECRGLARAEGSGASRCRHDGHGGAMVMAEVLLGCVGSGVRGGDF